MKQSKRFSLNPDKAGLTVLELANKQGITLRADCGGKGACGKCLVIPSPLENLSPVSDLELRLLNESQIKSGRRLACQVQAFGPVEVEIPPETQDTREAIGKTGLIGRKFDCSPLVRRIVLPVIESIEHEDLFNRLERRASQAGVDLPPINDPAISRCLAEAWPHAQTITLVCHEHKGITAILPGEQKRSLGLAIDVGTTTIAAYLCDLNEGLILAAASAANPQRRYGDDVISRIDYAAKNSTATQEMQALAIEEINRLLQQCLQNAQTRADQVDEIVMVGNTTMQQLFYRANPQALGSLPFSPLCRQGTNWRAGDLGIKVGPAVNVYVFPIIAGFLGGDIVAATLAMALHNSPDMQMVIDIGTNGELVLGNMQGLWATSCATGPALEGAHISAGMRAISGAISYITWDENNSRLNITIIGQEDGAKARGLCGSGVIDAVAALRRAGYILPTGRLKEGAPGVIIDENKVGRAVTLVPATDSATGTDIQLTLSDVRQIQLAKAALFVGIKKLMEKAQISKMDRLILTGAFGARFDWESGVSIGMLPTNDYFNEVEAVENAAGLGAAMALLSAGKRSQAEWLAQNIKFVELANDPGFQTEFPLAMGFPPITSD